MLERAPACPVAALASTGLTTLALRVPSLPIAQSLIKATGRPLAAPSANRSGRITATEARHVAADLGSEVAMIIDGGSTTHGLESTVVDATGSDVVLLRPGAITIAELQRVLGARVLRAAANEAGTTPSSPGQLESHYAPAARLRLDALEVRAGEALLAFGSPVPETRSAMLNLSPRGDLVEAAANLFSFLRRLDETGTGAIAVMPIPHTGLGEAINDRLRRAAAPRPPVR